MKKLLLFLLMIAPLGVFAQAYQLNLQGTRQIGKGGTGLAQPTDATSLFTNPGSAAFLDENGATLGVTAAITKGTFTDARTNEVYKTDNPMKTPFNVSAVFGDTEGKWRYGISVYTPFGSTNKWEPESVGRFDVKEISLLTISVQPTVSYKINDQWGVGVGLAYTYGQVDIQKDLPVQFSNGAFGETQIKADANGFNVNAGIYYKPTEKVALALTYRSPLKMKSSGGTVDFDVPGPVQGTFPSQGIKATLPLPQVFGVGVSYQPHEHWVVNAEGYLSDWNDYDIINIEFEDDPVAGDSSTELIRHYKNGYNFRAGVEYLPGKNYELRAGISYSMSPIQDKYMSPDVPDANRINPSIGGSYIFSESFRVDAALLMEFIHRESHNVITDIDGTYNFDLILPSVGLTYIF